MNDSRNTLSAVNNMWHKLGRIATSACAPFHLIWEFTESDFPTFVVPNTAFGILAALAATPLVNTSGSSVSWLSVLQNFPAVLIFNWWHTFIFDLSHQWSPQSVAEDRINKPWRPIPKGKITPDQTRRLILVIIPLSLGLDYYMNVWDQGIVIHVITWMYNDLGGCDEWFFIRDLCTASAFAMFNSGALKIASGCYMNDDQCDVNELGHIWTGIISAVIFTTMQVQDLKDQEGDRLRNRKTVVLLFGESVSRASIALLVLFWSLVCVCFWGTSLRTFALAILPAIVVIWKVMMSGYNKTEDRRTWQLWSVWLICLYALPLVGNN
ncbi:hypothetical protein J7T55_015225 [Diaporthe amygdali]|uniref:uncharacterized protein n=1 Tax=Phomopsis amygdali TaxID=1214568 RepID=UPI0022FDEF1A|nr:uncharacterized protein J7T55_015225 [Diaporthe amygdali]KAJ0120496.1 hypothetical protein J7T55_015225 [Diaporthe amygdali]